MHTTLADWAAREAIPFAVNAPASFHAALANVVASLGDAVERSQQPLTARSCWIPRPTVAADRHCNRRWPTQGLKALPAAQ